MAGNGTGNVGYRRIITITIVSTAFIIAIDKLGWIDYLARMFP